ncbi:DUF4249 domain-containing protein [Mucilaginibacter litoreus]|uniref:DUF4249 domain-containing protein n=1 Tax=Mucilaginibacter litoreus TaxID=1048221 RepID=A0ABW3AXE6_9SPHI
MKKRLTIPFLLITCFVILTCKKPFYPTVQAQSKSYLVVEGFINTGNDSTVVKLSRTVNVSDSTRIKAETGAKVSVIDDTGTSYLLTEVDKGKYAAGPMPLNSSHKYRLDIITSGGLQYQSDLVEAKNAPPIDTIGYKIRYNGLQINISSHDPANNTHYYRWEYDEDWRFHAKYESFYIAKDDTVVRRTPEEDIYNCFNKAKSSTIVIGSSVKLTSDVISEAPLTLIPSSSQKISVRYSIMVREYALSREAYLFYENLKKNTEQLGSIFDALPSEISGNIHNVNDTKEPVIGYITAGTYTKKRKYINKSELPNWQTAYPEGCMQDTALFVNPVTKQNDVKFYILGGKQIATSSILTDTGVLLGYLRTDFICADCTLTGTKKRPDFWEDN